MRSQITQVIAMGRQRRRPSTDIAEAVLEVLRQPTMDMGLAGADEVNKQMRSSAGRGGAPADYHAAVDSYRAMIQQAFS